MVELTRFAHDLLTRHRVRHWLDYGALLGAIREQAFIPWDNDVDMGVLAEDMGNLSDLAADVRAAGYHLDGSDPYGVIRINYSKINEQHVDLVPWYAAGDLLTTTLRWGMNGSGWATISPSRGSTSIGSRTLSSTASGSPRRLPWTPFSPSTGTGVTT
jgi:hypothetical protein